MTSKTRGARHRTARGARGANADTTFAAPVPLAGGAAFEHRFTVGQPGEAWAGLTLAAPGTSWERGEAAVAVLETDGVFRQEVVLAGGEEPLEYSRLLGRLEPGPHLLRLFVDRALSARGARAAVHAVRTGGVSDGDPAALVWRHAPLLHYRHLDGAASFTTDTPLLMFYRFVSAAQGSGRAAGEPSKGIEYHIVFSHEDAGTDLTGLLARWGHTTDIEWVYRVFFDREGAITREEFQAPRHRTRPFAGRRALGGHPVLQAATRNGMVSDRPRCRFKAALTPALAQSAGEPREGVLQRFPWVYRVSALEVRRQATLDATPRSGSRAAADLRTYLFLQWKRRGRYGGALEASVRVGSVWYDSAWGDPDLAFRGSDAESTAVRLPAGTGEDGVAAIALRAFEAPSPSADVALVRAFFLDETYRPRPPLPARGAARLSRGGSRVVVWERG